MAQQAAVTYPVATVEVGAYTSGGGAAVSLDPKSLAGLSLVYYDDISRHSDTDNIHGVQTNGDGILDPEGWVDSREYGGAGLDAFLENMSIIDGVARGAGTRGISGASFPTPSDMGNAQTLTFGWADPVDGTSTDYAALGRTASEVCTVKAGFVDLDTNDAVRVFVSQTTQAGNHSIRMYAITRSSTWPCAPSNWKIGRTSRKPAVAMSTAITVASSRASVARRCSRSCSPSPTARDTTEAAPAASPIDRLVRVSATGKLNESAANASVPSRPTK